MQFIELDSPFAIYESGSGYVLPNILPELTSEVVKRLEQEPIDTVLQSLRHQGQIYLSRKISEHDIKKIWYSFLALYLKEEGRDTPSTATRIEFLRLMLSDEPNLAWNEVRERLLTEIDDLSGWSRSFLKDIGEREHIWRDESGNYYKREGNITYQVVGAKTLEETRLDFLTEQIARNFGTIRTFLDFFTLLAISHDYVIHRDHYPTSMKVILQDRQWPSLSHRWSLLQWHPVRTVVWRPWSNLCDPQWLAGDLLGRLTDTLKIKPFKAARVLGGAERQLGPEFVQQADFALDTNLRIGDEEAIVLMFEGREFRWINASLESDTRISVGLRNGEDYQIAEEQLNRLLSILVWEYETPVAKKSGPIIGMKRTLPLIISPRSIFSLKVDPINIGRTKLDSIGPTERLALSLFREATNSRSVFYAFLNYWKVVEVIFPKQTVRFDWVNNATSLPLERERVADILKSDPQGLAHHLDENRRNAIVHVFKQPYMDPDSSQDSANVKLDLSVVRSLAKNAMRTLPAFKN